MFFAISGPLLVSVSSPMGQSLCWSISIFIGSSGWRYARRRDCVKLAFAEAEMDKIGRKHHH
ncbi:hypothetical protein [Synechococcus sp. CCY 9618]|uniref:hypothetical protein n=1 Tax=Synechococcus sp. CCY 9618 TaxID=2815602 RepID=UPI001C237F3B|nr:hypothetical protein [Synechococcus sp. CCY 9618]